MWSVIISSFAVAFCLFGVAVAELPNVWINEFHYDNTGSDVGEFVEVSAPADFTELEKVTLTFYNGGDGKKYATAKLDGFTKGETSAGFTLYYFDKSGIQNGAPDGFSLDYDGSILQFLSYEGDILATDGPANGTLSVDVGVMEPDDAAVGESLQLQGSGTQYNHFAWAGPLPATKGAPNAEQALPVCLTSFSACCEGRAIKLFWRTESETDNLGFVLDRHSPGEEWQRRASYITHDELKGHGSVARPFSYTFIDDRVELGQMYVYRLRNCNINGELGQSFLLTVVAAEEKQVPEQFVLGQNYPNPFNPVTMIDFTLPQSEQVRLTVYDMLGNARQILLYGTMEKGLHHLQWQPDDLPSGVYWYELRSESAVQVKKALLLR